MLRRTLLFGAFPLFAQKRYSVLIIGDSISIGYAPFVQSKMSGIADVQRISGNGADSVNVRAHLDEWLSSGHFDLVSINCGLHDLKYTQRHQVEAGQYEQNLIAIFEQLEKHSTRILWVTTTPIHDERHAARKAGFRRLNQDVDEYNQIALKVAKARQIAVCDLNEVVRQGGAERMLSKDGTHYEPAGYEILGSAVAAAISRELKQLR
jgi:lysophospholipase L1-like esterase